MYNLTYLLERLHKTSLYSCAACGIHLLADRYNVRHHRSCVKVSEEEDPDNTNVSIVR
jgi:hypothetical protein